MNITLYLDSGMVAYLPDRHLIRDMGETVHIMSENGDMIVLRLSEQNGKRGRIKLDKKVKLLNFLEDVIGEADIIEYKPFEIITVGINKAE